MLFAKWRPFCPGENELIIPPCLLLEIDLRQKNERKVYHHAQAMTPCFHWALLIYTYPSYVITMPTYVLTQNRHQAISNNHTDSISIILLHKAYCVIQLQPAINQLISPGQNGHHFADDMFRCIFVNEKFCILIEISLHFVLKAALVQVMAWCRIGDKPLPEQMLVRFTDAYMRH